MAGAKLAGLVGNPIAHSLSPCIHTAAYEALGLDWEYGLYQCLTDEEFKKTVAGMADGREGFIGLNITMPFKSAAFKTADRREGLSAEAALGVNVFTFMVESGSSRATIVGSNTDGAGIVGSLKSQAQLDIQGISAIVCGTGSTSAAAVIELIHAGASMVTILGRDIKRVQSLADRLISLCPSSGSITAATYDDAAVLEAGFASSALIIDATPVGMNPNDLPVVPVELITSKHTVLDVVYGHGETQLLREAKARGAAVFDGLGMLIEQAALTIEIWAAAQERTVTAPRDLMLMAAQNELELRELKKTK